MGLILKFDIKIKSDKRTIASIKNYEIPINKFTFLFGESGIGKTIINKTVFGLLDSKRLDISLNESEYKKYISSVDFRDLIKYGFFVFQEPSTHLNPVEKISTQLNEGELNNGLDNSAILNELWDKEEKDFKNITDIYPLPYRPSGGEKQRLLLAMALKKMDSMIKQNSYGEFNIFLFDEPSGNLDNYFRNVFFNSLIKRFINGNFTILLITHDYSFISLINKKYSNLLDKFRFKELYKENNQLYLKDFNIAIFNSWFNNLHVEKSFKTGSKLILNFNSKFSVFGKNLIITDHLGNEANLKVHEREIVYLKAPSGAGKTTLTKIIMGLVKADVFNFQLMGMDFSNETKIDFWKKYVWGRFASMVFQHADESLNMNSTILGSLKTVAPDFVKNENAVKDFLSIFYGKFDQSFLLKKVKYLSGGQKQKLNLARSLLLNTNLLILDEPVSGMDFNSIKEVMNLIVKYKSSNKGILLISHNEDIFSKLISEESVYFLKLN